jgi:hypothetical protein
MEQIKKDINADPYAALFGRRWEPFGFPGNFEKHVMSLYRSFFGIDKAKDPRAIDTTARPKTANTTSTQPTQNNKPASSEAKADKTSYVSQAPRMEDHEYDPISGRMVPKKPQPSGVSNKATGVDGTGPYDIPVGKSTSYNERIGYLSAIEQSRESAEPIVGSETARAKDDIRLSTFGVPQEYNAMGKEPTKGQESEPLKKSQADSYDITEPTNKEPSGEILCQASRQKNVIVLKKPNAECHEDDIKEHIRLSNLDREVGVGRDDGKKPFRPSEIIARDTQGPRSFTVLDTAQQQERLMREEKAEDLDLLRASDIRSLYSSQVSRRAPEAQRKARKDMDHEFDSYVDPLSDIDARGVREKFQHHAAVETDMLAGPEGTKQLPSQGEESSISRSPSQVKITESKSSGEQQARDELWPNADDPLLSETYRVLAYDPSTLQVTQADTTSTLHTTHETLHPTEILPRLNNPAKFLPHFRGMQAEGYEIISGGGDLLVFRKPQPSRNRATVSRAEEVQSDASAGVRTEPLFSEEDTSRSKSAHRSSPEQGTANAADSASGNGYVQGINMPPQKSESKVGKILRRLLIGGFATAATCYALGVVSEYFRTGGQNGRGIDAFTEFESERRHRDRK